MAQDAVSCPGAEIRSRQRPIASMIWSAVFVHLNGLAFSFQNLIHCSSAQVSSSIEQKTPRSSRRRCSSADHRSTWFSHEEYVGVKCSWHLGGSSSHLLTAGALCTERLSQIRRTARPGSTVWSIPSGKPL